MPSSADSVLCCYRSLLARLWEQAALVLGEAAVGALFESALFNASSDHSLLQGVQLTDAGPDLSGLEEGRQDPRALRAALEGWVEQFFSSLHLLTGDLLVRQLRPLWDTARQELEGVSSHE